MISDSITKMDFVFVNTSAEQKVSRKETEGTENKDFNSYLKAKDSSDKTEKAEAQPSETKETKTKQYKRLVSEETKKVTDISELEEKIEELNPEVFQQVVAGIRQIIDIIQETFGVSENEIKNALSELGLEGADLLSKNGINELISKLIPDGGPSSLLLNSEFSNAVKEIQSIISDVNEMLKNNLSMSNDDIKSLIQKLNDSIFQTETNQSEITENVVKTGTDSTENQNIATKVENAYQTEKPEKSESKSNSGKENPSENLSQNLMNKLSEVLEQSGNTETESVKIIKQIVNEIKLTVKQDMTKFEMQLNPEHLGKVSLQVVSKDGAITAQIAAGNAAVKEAIESQITVLKQSLEEQGIKVESIEVTIASHGFEQNNQGNENDFENNNSKKSSSLRNFDGSQDEELEISVEEQLMQENGSTVSYSA